MSDTTRVKILLGVANVGDRSKDTTVRYDAPSEVIEYLNAFHEYGGRQLDTARAYSPHAPGSSEARLGDVDIRAQFAIDTKVVSFSAGSHRSAKITESVDNSLASLKIPSINVEYLHSPDRETPFEETVKALDDAYKAGKFKQFGLSNFRVDEVEQILKICEDNNYVKPTVYQGQYNPIVRSGEKELFPFLRKHGIAFYAWSPAVAGLFAGNHKNIKPGDRFDTSHFIGQLYSSGYMKDNILAAIDRVIDLAAENNLNGHAVALRWTIYHSKLQADAGDAVIVAASSISQLKANFGFIDQGPLPDGVARAIDKVYSEVEGTEFPYHN